MTSDLNLCLKVTFFYYAKLYIVIRKINYENERKEIKNDRKWAIYFIIVIKAMKEFLHTWYTYKILCIRNPKINTPIKGTFDSRQSKYHLFSLVFWSINARVYVRIYILNFLVMLNNLDNRKR